MTNGVEGSTHSISLQFNKEFDIGDRSSLDIGVGYAFLDAEVGNPVNSSTAGSSYEEVATAVLNNVQLGPALWANRHNFVVRARYRHEWADGYPFSVGVFLQRRSGRPFSYTYEDDTVEDHFGDSDDEERVLIYVPTGPNDPIMDFSQLSQAEIDEFFAFLERTGLSEYAGGIAPKNGFNGPWSTDMDVRLQQDFRLFGNDGDGGHVLQVFLDIENFLNIFSDSNNARRYTNTGDIQEGVRVYQTNEFNPNNQYEVEAVFDEGINLDVDDSVYRIQLGFRYRF